jgi:hypothetical protein
MTLSISFTIAGVALTFSYLGVAVFIISKFIPWEWYVNQFVSDCAEKLLLIAILLFCTAGILMIASVLLTGEIL